MDEKFINKYGAYEGIDTSTFKHIPEISCYNNNYFIGLKREGQVRNDLIFTHSDDDNLTEYYHINGGFATYIGYEIASEGVFILSDVKCT